MWPSLLSHSSASLQMNATLKMKCVWTNLLSHSPSLHTPNCRLVVHATELAAQGVDLDARVIDASFDGVQHSILHCGHAVVVALEVLNRCEKVIRRRKWGSLLTMAPACME